MRWAALATIGLSSAAPAMVDVGASWRAFDAATKRACPSHHVEWLCGDCQPGLVERFDATLTRSTLNVVRRLTDLRRRCAAKQAGFGFGCEVGKSIDADRRIGLMLRFVANRCRVVRLKEAAVCSRTPEP